MSIEEQRARTPVAAVPWLLALTPAAAIAAKGGFILAVLISVVQAAVIVIALMRFAWGTRIHLLVLGIGALFSTLLLAVVSLDRAENRVEMDRFDTTVRGAELRAD